MDNWKKDGLPTTITNKQITVIGPDGKLETILKTDKNYSNILDLISKGEWEEVINTINITRAIVSHSNNKFQIKDGCVYIKDVKVPNVISNKIIKFTENKLPVKPLLAFWDNLNENPSNRSVNQLFDFLEINNHPITPDGHFIAYRVVNSDFKDKYTNTMDNNVGQIVSMPRNLVDEDPTVTCSHGLHIANYYYANNVFKNDKTDHLLLVKVNPKNVVAVPTDYNNSKMRVCEFEVLKEVEFELIPTLLYEDKDGDTDREGCYYDDCDCHIEGCPVCESQSDCEICGSTTYEYNNFKCEYCEEEEEEEEEKWDDEEEWEEGEEEEDECLTCKKCKLCITHGRCICKNEVIEKTTANPLVQNDKSCTCEYCSTTRKP